MTALEFIQKKQKEHKETHGVYADVDTKIAEWCEEFAKQQLVSKSIELSREDKDKEIAEKWHSTWKYISAFPANRESFIKGMQYERKVSFTEKHLVIMFAYGHQLGMNSVLAIQSKYTPQPMEVPDTDKLRDEMIKFLKESKDEAN